MPRRALKLSSLLISQCGTVRNKQTNRFITIGYSSEQIDQQIATASKNYRNQLLTDKTKTTVDRIPLVITYNHKIRFMARICKDLQPFLEKDPNLSKLFTTRSLVAYRQPSNLRRISATNAQLFTVTPHDTIPCSGYRCQLCSFVNTSSFITGPNNLTYETTGKFSCNMGQCYLCNHVHYLSRRSLHRKNWQYH